MFENHGCTLFPDGWGGVTWRACCDVHDEAFATGATLTEFLNANVDLWQCVAEQGDIFAATLVLIGVMTGGALFFFLPWAKKRRR
ncbi:MAG TPA: hypothetical protein VGN98_08750 [Tianweitania sediminis]|jgi:hypothetical protein|nr:hypothetical protein [Tianweitania sediminis]